MPTATLIDIQRVGNQMVERYSVTEVPSEVVSFDIVPRYIQKTKAVRAPGNYSILTTNNKTVRIHNYPIVAGPTIDTRGAAGIKDLTVNPSSAYTGSFISTFRIVITTAAGTDKFDWYRDGVLGAAAVNITGGFQALAAGVQIKFTATTGHTLNDVFQVTAEPNPASFNVEISGYGG